MWDQTGKTNGLGRSDSFTLWISRSSGLSRVMGAAYVLIAVKYRICAVHAGTEWKSPLDIVCLGQRLPSDALNPCHNVRSLIAALPPHNRNALHRPPRVEPHRPSHLIAPLGLVGLTTTEVVFLHEE